MKAALRGVFVQRTLEQFEPRLELAEEQIPAQLEGLTFIVSHMSASYYAHFTLSKAQASTRKIQKSRKSIENEEVTAKLLPAHPFCKRGHGKGVKPVKGSNHSVVSFCLF